VKVVATLEDAQGFKQVGELGLAFVLSSLIGLEREWRQKSAGLRTHTLVGVGSALFLIVSKYGFNDVRCTSWSSSATRRSPPGCRAEAPPDHLRRRSRHPARRDGRGDAPRVRRGERGHRAPRPRTWSW
jgi:hypothetical protein